LRSGKIRAYTAPKGESSVPAQIPWSQQQPLRNHARTRTCRGACRRRESETLEERGQVGSGISATPDTKTSSLETTPNRMHLERSGAGFQQKRRSRLTENPYHAPKASCDRDVRSDMASSQATTSAGQPDRSRGFFSGVFAVLWIFIMSGLAPSLAVGHWTPGAALGIRISTSMVTVVALACLARHVRGWWHLLVAPFWAVLVVVQYCLWFI